MTQDAQKVLFIGRIDLDIYKCITEDIVTTDLESLSKVKSRIDIFQIDDGYQTAVGDWLSIDSKKFPNGMKYIADKIGEEYVIPALGVWDNYDEIDFDSLPSQFVLKCTHDSGGLAIVRDKTQFNVADAREKFEKSLKTNYYYHGREWPYKNVKPHIIAEQYIEQTSRKQDADLADYKFYCFNI